MLLLSSAPGEITATGEGHLAALFTTIPSTELLETTYPGLRDPASGRGFKFT